MTRSTRPRTRCGRRARCICVKLAALRRLACVRGRDGIRFTPARGYAATRAIGTSACALAAWRLCASCSGISGATAATASRTAARVAVRPPGHWGRLLVGLQSNPPSFIFFCKRFASGIGILEVACNFGMALHYGMPFHSWNASIPKPHSAFQHSILTIGM